MAFVSLHVCVFVCEFAPYRKRLPIFLLFVNFWQLYKPIPAGWLPAQLPAINVAA